MERFRHWAIGFRGLKEMQKRTMRYDVNSTLKRIHHIANYEVVV